MSIKLKPKVIAKVAIMYQMGFSTQEIANALGRSKSDIKDIIVRHTSIGEDRSHQEMIIEKSVVENRKIEHHVLGRKRGFIQDERDHIRQRYEEKTYRKSIMEKYNVQKNGAKKRKIDWLFTPESWWKVWDESGKWEQRGPKGYMMCRLNDIGPYAPWNVYIGTARDNGKDRRLDLKRDRDEELRGLTKKNG